MKSWMKMHIVEQKLFELFLLFQTKASNVVMRCTGKATFFLITVIILKCIQ